MYKEAAISYKLSKRIANCIFYIIFFNKIWYVTCVYSVVRLDPMLVVNSTGEKVKKGDYVYKWLQKLSWDAGFCTGVAKKLKFS